MNRSLIQILACPIDKHYPLQLIELTTTEQGEIAEGLIICPKCLRFYPITQEIPTMLPDEFRNKKEDNDFLIKWKDTIPDIVAKANRENTTNTEK